MQLTDKNPGHKVVCQIPSWIWDNVGYGDLLELLASAVGSGIHGPENGPGHAATDEADAGNELQKANQQVGVHGVMLQHIGIRELVHLGDPVPESHGRRGRALPGLQNADIGTGDVDSVVSPTQDQEAGDHDDGDDQRGHQRRDQGRNTSRGTFLVLFTWLSGSV